MTLERTQSRLGNNILLMTDLYPLFAAAASWKTRRTADSFELPLSSCWRLSRKPLEISQPQTQSAGIYYYQLQVIEAECLLFGLQNHSSMSMHMD